MINLLCDFNWPKILFNLCATPPLISFFVYFFCQSHYECDFTLNCSENCSELLLHNSDHMLKVFLVMYILYIRPEELNLIRWVKYMYLVSFGYPAVTRFFFTLFQFWSVFSLHFFLASMHIEHNIKDRRSKWQNISCTQVTWYFGYMRHFPLHTRVMTGSSGEFLHWIFSGKRRENRILEMDLGRRYVNI